MQRLLHSIKESIKYREFYLDRQDKAELVKTVLNEIIVNGHDIEDAIDMAISS